MCVCCRERERKRERERERERERTASFPRPAYPKILLSVLQTACVCIFRFMTRLFSLFCLFGVFFGKCTTNQSKQKKCQRKMFLSSFKNSVWTHIFNYQSFWIRHLDASILFTSAKVLDKRPQKNFFKSNAPCVLLSLMVTCHFLNGWWLVGARFLGL